jgi:uncharacterized protein with HEPN domain
MIQPMLPEVRAAPQNMAVAADEALHIFGHVASPEDWQTLTIHRLTVERCLIMLGEEAFQLTKRPEADQPALPLQEIDALRHRLVHDYLRVDPAKLYLIVRDDLPALRATIQSLMDQDP